MNKFYNLFQDSLLVMNFIVVIIRCFVSVQIDVGNKWI